MNTTIFDQIIEELIYPFRDPREFRTPFKDEIGTDKLFYMLIDANERTFRKGTRVTATVIRIIQNKQTEYCIC